VTKFISNSAQETQDIAIKLLPLILHYKIVLLKGDLGVGKTVMSAAIIKDLCQDPNIIVTSPTFNILKIYDSKKFGQIWHYDLYRVKSLVEIEEIGLVEAINTKQNITLIEWPEIILPIISQNFLIITFDHDILNNTRTIISNR
jgi:tRNA threonylcarbamoyl adenosine modification protein YjeE